MSFGAAAARPGVPDGTACPCGSGRHSGGCCGPILRGAPAETAVALMRSRYTAFSVGDAAHLRATWHPRTRPGRLELDPDLVWSRLEILDTRDGEASDDAGTVEFRAHWRDGADAGALRERSRFGRVRGSWHYIDGDVL